MAQIIGAIHVVYEQKYIGKYDAPPLLVVGLEGSIRVGVCTVESGL